MIDARFYAPEDANRWDAFCAASFCSTFLHTRRFLSYHGDRFLDRSVILHQDDRWLGIVSAARHREQADVVVSHPGITYGGVIHDGRLRGPAMIDALQAAARLWRKAGFRQLQYKPLPWIYHQSPAQDDLYALFRLGARRYRCDLSCCIDLRSPLPWAGRRLRSLRKAGKEGVTLIKGIDVAPALWAVLEGNLQRRHGVRPVHSIDEMTMLAERFPEDIGFHAAEQSGEIVAGAVLFNFGTAVHAQYIASSERGQQLGALDAVFDSCIDAAKAAQARFFDFGISTEAQGTILNEGLYSFKSEFGGSGLAYEHYELNLVGV